MAQPNAASDTESEAFTWPTAVERFVICIGAQKSATSWLFDMAKHDPQVCVSGVKEVGYWNLHNPDAAIVQAVTKQRKRAILKSRAKLLRDTVLLRDRSAAKSQLDKWTSLYHLDQLHDEGDHQGYIDFLTKEYAGEAVVLEATPSYALLPAGRYAEMRELHLSLIHI